MPNLIDILLNIAKTLLDGFVNFIPRLIGAIVILVIGSLLSNLLRKVVGTVLSKAGIDKLGDQINKIDFVKGLGTEIKLSAVTAQVLYFFVIMVFVSAAAETLGVAAITGMVVSLMNFIPQLIACALMLLIGVVIADALKSVVVSVCKSFNISSGKLLGSIVFFFFLIIMVINAVGQAGINTALLESSFNLIIGGIIFAFAVGYGIASRDVMANILSSFYTKNRYREGQTIEIDGVKGRVLSIDATFLTLQTGETTTVFPLQTLQTKKVEVFQ
ncbi:MAG: hypothetical protein H7Z72_17670 [Bacteroidetes bacterium]|nr:hypothetical protein [Fibrella sp.]